MEAFVLTAGLIYVIALGYWMMERLDRFLNGGGIQPAREEDQESSGRSAKNGPDVPREGGYSGADSHWYFVLTGMKPFEARLADAELTASANARVDQKPAQGRASGERMRAGGTGLLSCFNDEEMCPAASLNLRLKGRRPQGHF